MVWDVRLRPPTTAAVEDEAAELGSLAGISACEAWRKECGTLSRRSPGVVSLLEDPDREAASFLELELGKEEAGGVDIAEGRCQEGEGLLSRRYPGNKVLPGSES